MNYDKTHAFIQIGKDIKAGKIPGLVLLYGREEFLVNFYAAALKKKYINKSTEALDFVTLNRDNLTLNAIIENVETMPLLSERKMVYIPEFIDRNFRMPKNFADNTGELDRFIKFIEGMRKADSALLLITFAKQSDERDTINLRNSKLFKAIDRAADRKTGEAFGAVYDFDVLDQNQLIAFIEKRFNGSGKKFQPGIASLIARESGYGNKNIEYGLYNLDNDLRKIIAHSGASPEISSEDILSVITVNPENNVFAMLDAIGRNRKDESFKFLHDLLQDGSSTMQLIAMITRQMELMLITREMKDTGMSLAQIQKELKKEKIHKYRTQKALEAGNRLGTEDLKRILSSSYEVEINIKSGLMPGQLALEYFVAGI